MVGFKKTEIGLLPEDWNAIRIKEMYKLNNEQITQSNIPYNEFYYLDLSSVKNGVVTIPQEKIQIDEAPSRAKRVLMQNDVIIATVRPNLKGFAIANFETDSMICSTGFALVKTKNELDAKYLLQNLFSHSIANQIENLVVGSNYPAISNSDVENLIIPQPPLPEQQKIATILSKWDELIDTQTKLIEAKEKQKTSLMQKLLSGEVRFPGFDQKWKSVTLGEIAEFSNGKAHENIVDKNGQYKLITSKFISTEGRLYRSLNDRLTPLFKNDIVMVMSDIPKGKTLGKCYLVEQNDVYSLNQRIGRFVIKKHDPRFMFYLLNRNIHFLAFDSGVGQTNLRKDDILECPLFIPELKEQEKIANTLCACDNEIQSLKDNLEALNLQKKGLMQQLLTGKIRVKV